MRLERVPIRFLAERIFLILQIVGIYSSRLCFQVGDRWFKLNYHVHTIFDWIITKPERAASSMTMA